MTGDSAPWAAGLAGVGTLSAVWIPGLTVPAYRLAD